MEKKGSVALNPRLLGRDASAPSDKLHVELKRSAILTMLWQKTTAVLNPIRNEDSHAGGET